MKKIIITIFLSLTLLVGVSFPCSAYENLNKSYRPPKNSKEELYPLKPRKYLGQLPIHLL